VLFTFLLTLVVIILGAYTRLTDAGLSCPDWPNCYGFLTAPHTAAQLQDAAMKYPHVPVDIKKAWTEMTHRYFAGTLGILILILSGSILFSRKAKSTKATLIAAALVVLLGIQVALGMLTVTEKLKPVIVLAHLMTGLSILSLLWWAYLDLHLKDDSFINKSHHPLTSWLWMGCLIVLAQIILGGWVSTHYAGLACIDFPYCNGELLPNMKWQLWHSDLTTIHMLHRIGALITAFYLMFLSLLLVNHPAFKSIAFLILSLIALQLMLGVLNIIWLRPVWIALTHHTVAILLLMTLITALVKNSFIMDKRHGNWAK
jgi:cytochrome c oxidase assembly protein subunit 15